MAFHSANVKYLDRVIIMARKEVLERCSSLWGSEYREWVENEIMSYGFLFAGVRNLWARARAASAIGREGAVNSTNDRRAILKKGSAVS